MFKRFKGLNLNIFFMYFFIIMYFEILFRCLEYGTIININLIYLLLFSLSLSFILSAITKLFNSTINKVLTFIFVSIITILFLVQFVFKELFSVLFSFFSSSMANQAIDFINIVFDFIGKNILAFSLFLIPIIILILFNNIFDYNKNDFRGTLIYLLSSIVIFFLSILSLFPGREDMYSAYDLYVNNSDNLLCAQKFGVLTTMRLDLKKFLFGSKEKIDIPIETIEESEDEKIGDNKRVEYGYNAYDIDFNTLANSETNSEIKQLNSYMNSSIATKKNQYTGMFKDKNLIFVLAEGFNEIAVDEQLTPTLYKLTHEGFIFNNFYSPVFLSTTGGEFQAMTGLVPDQQILSTWKSKVPSIVFSYGNVFKNIGYNVNAYHNWTYSYYSRDKTMPTLGFNQYLACRNGLEKYMNCKNWPTSDIDMMNVTPDFYINNEKKFMTYYITLSGHAEYNFFGNYIAKKNKKLVDGLKYSEQIKAYLATQIELDRALETLISKLESAGILEDTVLALVGDHYPYTLNVNLINERSDYKKDDIVEVNRSKFILWNSGSDKIEVNKVGSQIDVLPTILNLFGIEYDSRAIMGKDILSENEGLAIFSNRSWVSDKGTYFFRNKKFVPKENVDVSEEYVNSINNLISNKFKLSKMILDNNYYDYILSHK